MSIFSEGRMIGDYEVIQGIPYQSSVFCIDQEAVVYEIKKRDFMALKDDGIKPEVWNAIVKASARMNRELLSQYAEKLTSFFELRKRNSQANPDLKYICHNLMKETKFSMGKDDLRGAKQDKAKAGAKWLQNFNEENKSVAMYALKKHLQEKPECNDIVLSKLKRQEFENLKTSKYAESVMNRRHNAYEYNPPSTIPIESPKQVAKFNREVH